MDRTLIVLVILIVTWCHIYMAHGQGRFNYYDFYRSRSRQLQDRPTSRESRTKHRVLSQSKPSYLDPVNFRLPDMTLNHMQTILGEIEMHIRPKENNLEFYSGARLLIMLLQEECFRLRRSGDPKLAQFCNSFSSRFRSFFF